MLRAIRGGTLALALVLGAGCDGEVDGPEAEKFFATLSGQQEVPPRTTDASGISAFTVNADKSVSFSIDVTSIRNVFMAHVHGPAPFGANAPILVTLVPNGAPKPLMTGRLVEGSFTATDNPSAVSMDSLLNLMRNGQTYVNVHTTDNVNPANTGPGDFPGGEIRGQINRQTGGTSSQAGTGY